MYGIKYSCFPKPYKSKGPTEVEPAGICRLTLSANPEALLTLL